ncbi:unnamed protein product [Echinostoma caproni]|uniref:Ion_trans domain-containing protein n=1 Tax=Echinostoma caproni TaxID=27848 RepID=A0A183APE7_9TREM|nr:unnamed protein product [Echinostoma caproni]
MHLSPNGTDNVNCSLSKRIGNSNTVHTTEKYKAPLIQSKNEADIVSKSCLFTTAYNNPGTVNNGSSNYCIKRPKAKDRSHKCHRKAWTCFYFSPSGRGLHLWCGVISTVVVYHLWVIIYRYVFSEICRHNVHIWFPLDYLADFLYLVDMIVSIRTGFLEDGVMQFDSKRMRIHYINSTQFYVDCLSLLPLDFLYLSVGFNSMLRIFRLCKVYKFWQFLDRAERHSTYPNVMRSAKLLFYYLTILHWNACVFRLVNDFCNGLWDPALTKRHTDINKTAIWNTNDSNSSLLLTDHAMNDHIYVHSVYWGLMSLISIGSLQKPNGLIAYMFLISQGILGVLLFATILGHVCNIVAHVSAGQKEFQGKMCACTSFRNLSDFFFLKIVNLISTFATLLFEFEVVPDYPDSKLYTGFEHYLFGLSL